VILHQRQVPAKAGKYLPSFDAARNCEVRGGAQKPRSAPRQNKKFVLSSTKRAITGSGKSPPAHDCCAARKQTPMATSESALVVVEAGGYRDRAPARHDVTSARSIRNAKNATSGSRPALADQGAH